MKNIEKVVIPVIIIVIITMLGIYYIAKEYEKQQAQKRAEEIKQTVDENKDESIDTEDLVYESTAMLVGKDEETGKLKFISVDQDKLFELEVTGKTPILGKHGNNLTLSQIPLGEILDVSYSIHSKDVRGLQISDEAWTFTDVTKFDINEEEGRMDVAGSTYKLSKTAIVSYGDELATFMDVTNVDTLTVKGYGRKVCSVIVERGHGYVRLMNDSYFEGGWIEVGQDIIKKVTEEMLIPVPEGSYHVRLTNRGYAAEEDVEIVRDEETVIDLSEVDVKEVAIGHVEFDIVPDYAQLFIDGVMTDFDERIPLEYGIHHVHVELAGYKSIDSNIRISDKYANIDMVLEEETDEETSGTTVKKNNANAAPANLLDTSSTGSGGTGQAAGTSSTAGTSTTAPVISNTRKVYVESPEGAEVFVDSMYVGIVPISFIKPAAGSHVITLSKSGYKTKSYTISVGSDDNDMTLSFSEMISENEEY